MIWAVTGVTFVGALIVCTMLLVALLPAHNPVGERLQQLSRPKGTRTEVPFRQRQKDRAERVLTDVGKIMPGFGKRRSYVQRLLVRAGYRRPEVALILRGLKVICPIILLALVKYSGLYLLNPIFFYSVAGLLGFLLPDIWLTSRVRRRQHRILIGLPDALDLLVVCVEAGLGLDQALMRVSQELRLPHPELSDEFQMVNLEMRVGKSRAEALRDLGVRTGVDDAKSLAAMLIQTDRFGTDLAQALRVHSESLRTKRRQRAEEMAAKTTVKMVPPLVFCIFPALFAVVLGPAVITLVRHLLPALK